ncbi:MAG: AbrB/MazE/SpoVT family DNA-binding domain-containing protein [Candidatus Aenigmarchaeota archaeon]|nr:AbrB/MazE/SpoVT family DNA-binding domain-containing protein [Candidatus Aenigmarchaeota archaeon]
MSDESIVTRGNQITLTKEIREKMHVMEGDIVTLNIEGDVLMISKRNPMVFDDFEDFLPERFDKTMKKIRSDEKDRLKRLGIVE